MNLVAGDGGIKQVRQLADGAPDRDLDACDSSPVPGQGEDARLAIGDAGNADALRRAHDCVGDAGIADIDLPRLLGQIGDTGLANAQLQALGRQIARAGHPNRIGAVGGATDRSRRDRKKRCGDAKGDARPSLSAIGFHAPAPSLENKRKEKRANHRAACWGAP
jgi:hypothetical protein